MPVFILDVCGDVSIFRNASIIVEAFSFFIARQEAFGRLSRDEIDWVSETRDTSEHGVVGCAHDGAVRLEELLPRYRDAMSGRIDMPLADLHEFTCLCKELGITDAELRRYDRPRPTTD